MQLASVARSEKRFVLFFALIVMGLTTLPYFLGFKNQGTDWYFSGFVLGVEDGNTYIAKMLSGAAGAWLFRSPYSALPQNGVLALPFYIWLGKMTSPPGQHVQLVAIYHWFRILSGILAIYGTYAFLAQVVTNVKWRRFGIVLIILGGGYGWLAISLGAESWLGSLPLEFYSPESFGFLGIYGFPHLALARAALMWGLVGYLEAVRNWETLGWRSGIKIGVWWLVLAVAQPMIGVVFGLILGLHLGGMGLWQLTQRRRGSAREFQRWRMVAKTAFLAGCVPAPFILYNVYIFSTDPYLLAWTSQNRIISPNPLHYLLAYGWILPFALFGAWKLIRKDPWVGWLFAGWLASLPCLAYAPVNLQRRLPEGAWVLLVCLSLVAVEQMRVDSRRLRWVRVGYVAFSAGAFPSTVMLLIGGVSAVQTPTRPIFLPAEEVAASQYLAENAEIGAVVLSAYETGNALPAWAPVHVVIGHGPESANLASLEPRVARFFQLETPDSERIELITEQDVGYIFMGPLEHTLGKWEPESSDIFQLVYQSPDYEIFKVKLPQEISWQTTATGVP